MKKILFTLALMAGFIAQAWGISFSTASKTYQLIDLTDVGQKATGATGTITYSSSNPKIVQVVATTGALRFVNSGLATITATDSNGGATASYSVTIEAAAATYRINNGNTYELTGTGKLGDKRVTDIPGITAQFGSDGEVTVVRNVGGGLGATTIDTNGYSFIYKPGTYPTMGTYYKFTPTTDGWLDVWGYFTDTSNSLVLTTESGTQVGSTVAAATGSQQHGYWQLTAGTVYYLYTNSYNWFNLTSFKFAPTLTFANKSVRLTNGTTSYTQSVTGATSGVTYSAKFMGMTGSINSSTGAVTMSGTGGAVEVTATSSTSKAYYVITVPYKSNTWVFNSTTMPINDLKTETDWALTYKVVTRDASQNITSLSNPVLANGTAFDGYNAHFISATAGLLINTGAKAFGATATLSGTDGLTLAQQYNLPYTNVSSVEKLTIKKGTVITIPDLQAGQYVKVRWQRHSPSVGNMVKVTNLTDLDDTEMTARFEIGTPTAGSDYVGWMMFKVKANGDVTIQGDVDGWINIDQIQLYAPGIVGTTDLLIKKAGNVAAPTYYEYLIKDGVVPSSIVTETYETRTRYILAVSGVPTLEFTLKPQSDVTASITTAGVLTVTSGYGTITVVEKLKSTNGYVVDKKEMPIAINKGVQTTISYPYTWDFVGRSETGRTIPSSETLTAFGTANNGANPYYWNNNNNGILGLLAVDETYGLRRHVAGSEMWINNTIFRESKGLRITLADYTTANNNQVKMGSNGALTVKSGATQKITMPGVPANAKIYVHGRKQSGAILQLGTTDLAAVSGATDVYMAQVTTAGDATLNVAGVDIYRIGVSIDDKSISSVGAATEARGYAVNYDYAQTFLGKQLKAYAVTGLNSDNTKLTTALIPRVAAGTGVMLRPATVESTTTTWPLFTTDINDNTVTADNKLIGVVTPPADNVDQQTGSNYNYMLSTKGYSVNYPVGATTGTVVENVSGLGYYLVLKQGTVLPGGSTYAGGKPKANSAYLQLPEILVVHTGTDADPTAPATAKSFYFIDFTSAEDASATGIESVETAPETVVDNSNRPVDNNYYTLYGVKVENPSKGIYIHRGKKIIIK